MNESFRWYGPSDPVTLSDIRQAGASSVVSALHEIQNGVVWNRSAIETHQKIIKNSGLNWNVVESVPIHEDIKQRNGSFELYIENYKRTLENLSSFNIKTVCYNFMPVLDWTRTDLYYPMPDGSKTLYFSWIALAAFDLFLVKRDGAKDEYDSQLIKEAENYFKGLLPSDLERLSKSIIAGLPGAEEGYSVDEFKAQIEKYSSISKLDLQKNLILFLEAIIPTAESLGIRMCIHPDDPPFPLFGIPRVVSTSDDLETIFSKVPSISNGLTFCTGSLGVRSENNLIKIFEKWSERVHFLHLRSTHRDSKGNFYEANHLEGDVDMFSIVRKILMEEHKRNKSGRLDWKIPMRPDHGHQMLDDLNKKTNPGYSAIGRLRGLAELRGLSLGIQKYIM
tara:strand:+ start:3856 stop:5034 length:1179 start_codon:yes stop_codon:yes gene_type:complete